MKQIIKCEQVNIPSRECKVPFSLKVTMVSATLAQLLLFIQFKRHLTEIKIRRRVNVR